MALGQNIKRLRRKAGLHTQKALAELLGVPQPQVSDWENDRYAMLETLNLVKIAKGLCCSVDELLAGADPDYDRVRSEAGADEIPVIAEGDAFPEAGHANGKRPVDIVQRITRPADVQDPGAYGIPRRS